jgi:uncharacterized protein YbbC (DUF1343 family)
MANTEVSIRITNNLQSLLITLSKKALRRPPRSVVIVADDSNFRLDQTLGLIGSRKVLQEIRDGLDPKIIEQNWQEPLAQFHKLRSKYLLYQ